MDVREHDEHYYVRDERNANAPFLALAFFFGTEGKEQENLFTHTRKLHYTKQLRHSLI